MKQKRTQRLKRVVSGLLSLTMIASMSAVLPANAEEEGKQAAYPYTVFAADENGGITLNLDYLTVNGNGVTNGVYSTTAMYPNINGTISENEFVVDEIVSDDENTTDSQEADKPFDVSRDMIYIHNKLMDSWFNKAQNYADDYTLSEMNINLNSPVYVTGRLNYEGNVSLNSAIGAVSDVNLSGGNLNGNNAVIYSKFGDIKISDSQASMNGLIYAPFGTVTIDCDNFNLNGLIIAQNVVVNSTGVNINYNNTWAEFVGTETEELSWTFADWKYLADTDEDGLPNLIEKEIGTKPYEADTDGDLLPDGYEVLSLGTDPLKVDTDDNGVSDYDEDFDEDGLSNGKEYEMGTRPFNDDTDGDNLKDGDEVNTYFTDPLEVDTDKDGLNDDDEIYFGTDPNNHDSDDNGSKDGDEKRSQTFIHKVENEDCAVTEVIVSMEATGNLQKTTTVESIMNKDMLCTGVVGLVGEPFSIETTSDYEKATLTYVIDNNKLGDTEFDNLMFLWYDEKKDEFVELDTILDEENSTVSINTPHFSKYMLVDKKEWFDAWKRASLYFQDEYEPLAAAICYDCSGSMSGNDPKGYRKLAIDNFIDSMTLTDKTALISFEDEAKLVSGFSDNKEELKGLVNPYFGGGTNVRSSVEMAIEQLNTVQHWYTRHIILLSDGDVNININLANNTVDDLIKKAVDNNIKIHTIGLGSGADKQKLKDCAEYTGGQYFTAETAEKLDAIYKDLSKNNHEDGLPDEFEVSGLVISNAQIFYTDPEIQDCDDDGLIDGKEILIDKSKSKTVTVHSDDGDYTTYSSVVFGYNSDPWDDDTDDDGMLDGKPYIDPVTGIVAAPTDPDPSNGNYTIKNGYLFAVHRDSMRNNVQTKLGDYMKLDLELEDFVSVEMQDTIKTNLEDHDKIQELLNMQDGWFKEYTDEKTKELLLRYIFELIRSNGAAAVGSNLLMFRQDKNGDALHSQTNADITEYISQKYGIPFEDLMPFYDKLNNWQILFGYNQLYDDVFEWGTDDNMYADKLYFSDNGIRYVLWYWRGDYLNLGAGSEIGLYYRDDSNPIQNVISTGAEMIIDDEHWFSVDFQIPMTLSLYWAQTIPDANNIYSLYNWAPENPQWWITGFDPNWKNDVPIVEDAGDTMKSIDKNNLIMVGSVDLSHFSDDTVTKMAESVSESERKGIIVDTKHKMVWFVFGRMIGNIA